MKDPKGLIVSAYKTGLTTALYNRCCWDDGWLVNKLYSLACFFNRLRSKNKPTGGKKKRIVKHRGRKRTITDTLEKLDFHFNNLIIADDQGLSENNWSIRRALKKMGPYVVPPETEVNGYKIDHRKRPSLIFVAPYDKKIHDELDTKDHIAPSFIYAIKLKTVPYYVERLQQDGDLYEVGVTWCATLSRHKKNVWIVYFVLITKDGYAYPMRYQKHTISVLSNKAKTHIPQTQWVYGSMDEEWHIQGVDYVKKITCQMFNFWQAKRSMWEIIVTKGQRRMVFSIEARDTKHYFKDRIRIQTPGGRAKPIIHFVEGFTRENGSEVIPHIRGLRQFTWNNYEVNVKNPELGNALILDEFDTPGMDDEEALKEKDYMSAPEVVNELKKIDDAKQENIADILKKAREA